MEIKNYDFYSDLMRNGFLDKLFFTDKLFEPWKTLLDYGCADGFQTKLIAKIFPDRRIIGYDEDEKLITMARNNGILPGNVSFFSGKGYIPEADVIFLSIVMHEVHSYKTIAEIKKFWEFVFSSNRKYVIMRDMIYPDSRHVHTLKKEEAAVMKYCSENQILGQLERFEQAFGSISRPEHLTHFMMKYLYIHSPNWNREVVENYTGVGTEHLKIGGHYVPSHWALDHKELYTLPYLKHRWRIDFSIVNYPITTHGKFIFRNTL